MISTTTSPGHDALCFEPTGCVPFAQGWSWQHQLQRRLLENPGGPKAALLLAEALGDEDRALRAIADAQRNMTGMRRPD